MDGYSSNEAQESPLVEKKGLNHLKGIWAPAITPPRLSRKAQNSAQNWGSLKAEIRKIYIDDDNTLANTMQKIEADYGFKACERKWKMQLKDWGFEKYVSASDMRILIAKAEKRSIEENKDTIFFNRGCQIPQEKIDLFKRRKVTKQAAPASPSAETPANITYHTPGSTALTPAAVRDISGINWESNSSEWQVTGSVAGSSGPSEQDQVQSMCELNLTTSLSSGEHVSERPKSYQQLQSNSHRFSMSREEDGYSDEDATCSDHTANAIKKISNEISDTGYEAIKPSDAPQPDACTNEVRSMAEKILARALELQERDRSILATLEQTQRSSQKVIDAYRDVTRESVALRVLIKSYEVQRFRQKKAESYARSAIELLSQPPFSSQQLEVWRRELEWGLSLLNYPHEAILRYHEATVGVEMSFGFEDGLQCRISLAKLLIQLKQQQEALNLLLMSCNDYLSTRPSPTYSGPFSSIVFEGNLAQKLSSQSFKDTMELIQFMQYEPHLRESCRVANATVALIQNSVKFPDFDPGYVLVCFMNLASEYSWAEMLLQADLVYKFAVPEVLLRGPERIILEREKNSEFRNYARHCQRTNNAAGLEIAFKHLESITLLMPSMANAG